MMEFDLGMKYWEIFIDRKFRLCFKYPAMTPQGQLVDLEQSQNHDSTRVHLISRDSQEVYFEVRQYRNLLPQEEYQRHKAYLEKRFALEGFAITELTDQMLGVLSARQYSFRWDDKQRVAILIQENEVTYRIIYDPRSLINVQILSTLELTA